MKKTTEEARAARGRLAPRPRVSKETPKLGVRDRGLARHHARITPDRTGSGYRLALGKADSQTVGRILDTAPSFDDSGMPSCAVPRRYYAASRGIGGIMRKPCGKRSCPACVLDWLAKATAPAWVYWDGGPVEVERFETENEWHWARRTRGIRMGEGGTPGVLVVPVAFDGPRVAFVPGDGVRGAELDAAYVGAVRSIPVLVDPPREGTRVPDPEARYRFGGIPRWMTSEQVVELAESLGCLVVSRRSNFPQWEATEDQNRLLVDSMR